MGNGAVPRDLPERTPCASCAHFGGTAHAAQPFVFCRSPHGSGTHYDAASGCRLWDAGQPRAGKRVIVCGGRGYVDRERVFHALDAAHAKSPIMVIVQGGAPGADMLASQWAKARGVLCDEFPADWNGPLKSKAGPARNQAMADAGADACIAFPGGPGTADMVRRAIAARIVVWKPFG